MRRKLTVRPDRRRKRKGRVRSPANGVLPESRGNKGAGDPRPTRKMIYIQGQSRKCSQASLKGCTRRWPTEDASSGGRLLLNRDAPCILFLKTKQIQVGEAWVGGWVGEASRSPDTHSKRKGTQTHTHHFAPRREKAEKTHSASTQ